MHTLRYEHDMQTDLCRSGCPGLRSAGGTIKSI